MESTGHRLGVILGNISYIRDIMIRVIGMVIGFKLFIIIEFF